MTVYRLDLPRWDLAKVVKTRRGGWPAVDKRGRVKLWRPVWDPLRGNQRSAHWGERHAAVKQVIRVVAKLATDAGIPQAQHIAVQLTWAPGRKVRADVDNLVAFQKVCCDALARGRKDLPGLHLVPDDTPQWMTKHMPVIAPPPAKGLWLTVEVIEGGKP